MIAKLFRRPNRSVAPLTSTVLKFKRERAFFFPSFQTKKKKTKIFVIILETFPLVNFCKRRNWRAQKID